MFLTIKIMYFHEVVVLKIIYFTIPNPAVLLIPVFVISAIFNNAAAILAYFSLYIFFYSKSYYSCYPFVCCRIFIYKHSFYSRFWKTQYHYSVFSPMGASSNIKFTLENADHIYMVFLIFTILNFIHIFNIMWVIWGSNSKLNV